MLIKCPECGKEISDKSKQCIHCGYPLEENKKDDKVIGSDQKGVPTKAVCSACGYVTYINDKFSYGKCPLCGSNDKWVTIYSTDSSSKSNVKTTPTVECPYCHSKNTSKISTTSKVVNTALFGLFGSKRHKEWHCNDCNSDF